MDEARAWTYLALVGLSQHAHTAPDTLTVGERRLLAVARAAATGAPVLAFDEPAAGMSPAERETLSDVLQTLAQAGRAILVVEHDLRLVAATADVVTVLDEGRAIAHGAPDEVLADAPSSASTWARRRDRAVSRMHSSRIPGPGTGIRRVYDLDPRA